MPSSAETLQAQCAVRRGELDDHAAVVATDPSKARGGLFHNINLSGSNVEGTLFAKASVIKALMRNMNGLAASLWPGARMRDIVGAQGFNGADEIKMGADLTRQRHAGYKNQALVAESRGEVSGLS